MAKPNRRRELHKSINKRFDFTKGRAEKEIAAVNQAIAEGYSARPIPGNTSKRSAVRVAGERLGENRLSFQHRVGSAESPGSWKLTFGIEPDWNAKPKARVAPKPVKLWANPKAVRRYLLTAAQDETAIHLPFWTNLKAFAAHIDAEIIIGGFTYAKSLFQDHAIRSGVFASELVPHIRPEVIEIGPHIVWYGTANILPTANDPLSGWETQTRDKWTVLPHAKISLKAVPVMPGARGKQIMTTGVVTHANYVQRNAGSKAEFHHTIGALIVEVATDGEHFCRQISANAKDGTFQDLDVLVRDGMVFTGNTIEAAVWGDIHREYLDPEVALGAWGFDVSTGECAGEESIMDVLKPQSSVVHDSFNFTARSHHTRHDPHERVSRRAEGRDVVEDEIKLTAKFLMAIRRPWAKTVHIDSNHNQHLHRWLKDPTAFHDAANAAYWCELNAATLRAAEANKTFLIHEYALRQASSDGLSGLAFVRAGQSYTVCRSSSPIECGLHADIGPNGARGSPTAFAKTVERIIGAHGHTPIIREAYYQAGTSTVPDMHYNTKGQGAWHQSHVIAYKSGKRALITVQGRRWRA